VPDATRWCPTRLDALARWPALVALTRYAASLLLRFTAPLELPGWLVFLFVKECLYELLCPPKDLTCLGALWEWGQGVRWALAGLLPHPLLWLGVLAMLGHRWRVAWMAGAVAFLGGLCFVRVSPNVIPSDHLAVGGYLWLGRMALVTAVGLWADLGARPAAAGPPAPHGG
jgi:hypothetical protein